MDCDAKRIPIRSVRATVIPSALSAVDQATVCSKRRHKLSAIRIGNANRNALSCCKIAESPMCWITHANSAAPTNAASKAAFLIGTASLRDAIIGCMVGWIQRVFRILDRQFRRAKDTNLTHGMSRGCEPEGANFFIGVDEVDVASPEGRISRRTPLNPHDGVIGGVDPDLAGDQVLVLGFRN